MKKTAFRIWLLWTLCVLLFLSACGKQGDNNGSTAPSGTERQQGEDGSGGPGQSSDSEEPETGNIPAVTGDFSVQNAIGSEIQPEGGVYHIKRSGTYTLSGVLQEGHIEIDAGEDKVELLLNGAEISCSTAAPINCISADRLTLTAAEDSVNVIRDGREASEDSEEDAKGGAVYAKSDLLVRGSGRLEVYGSYNNGIHTTKDLRIEELELRAEALNNALRGNDSVEIVSGSVSLISLGGNGIRTVDSDISKKGKQRGNVSILGGHVHIEAAGDGIDAACAVTVEGSETELDIKTGSYASKQDGSGKMKDSKQYLIVSPELYEQYEHFAALCISEDRAVLNEASFEMKCYGGRSVWNALLYKVTTACSHVIFAAWNGNRSSESLSFEGGQAGTELLETLPASALVSERQAVSAELNAWMVTGSADGRLEGDFVQLDTGGSGSTYSMKGIKAADEIKIAEGKVSIESSDDGIHANGGSVLGNGTKGAGGIRISGGDLVLRSGDDGIHADGSLKISGGIVDIPLSHEGLEANEILIEGGKLSVTADDDGLNACSGENRPLIRISGGELTVKTPAGDTDGIDSNGDYVQTGGKVLILSGSGSGRVAGTLDADGGVSVSGGTLAGFGGIVKLPEVSGNVLLYADGGVRLPAGAYTLKTEDGSEVLKAEQADPSAGFFIASDSLKQGMDYSLLQDSEVLLRWKQEQQSVTQNIQGGFGAGGPGGMPPGGPGRRP